MKNIKYTDYFKASPQSKLSTFLNSLEETNRTYDYYCNFDKILTSVGQSSCVSEFKTLLNSKNKSEMIEKFKKLLIANPSLKQVIPSLLAIRMHSNELRVLNPQQLTTTVVDFSTEGSVDELADFCEKTGLFDFIYKNGVSDSFLDFFAGIEVGLDSNARKNRSGQTMEEIVSYHLKRVCDEEKDYLHMSSQVSPAYIKNNYSIEIPFAHSQRKYDNAIYDSKNDRIYIFETNFYSGGGSKLKTVCKEFSSLAQDLKGNDKIVFVWITDGLGWHTAKNPLLDAFEKIDNIVNLAMLKEGFIKSIIEATSKGFSRV